MWVLTFLLITGSNHISGIVQTVVADGFNSVPAAILLITTTELYEKADWSSLASIRQQQACAKIFNILSSVWSSQP